MTISRAAVEALILSSSPNPGVEKTNVAVTRPKVTIKVFIFTSAAPGLRRINKF